MLISIQLVIQYATGGVQIWRDIPWHGHNKREASSASSEEQFCCFLTPLAKHPKCHIWVSTGGSRIYLISNNVFSRVRAFSNLSFKLRGFILPLPALKSCPCHKSLVRPFSPPSLWVESAIHERGEFCHRSNSETQGWRWLVRISWPTMEPNQIFSFR